MIDLNGKKFEGTAIFNGGNAGVVNEVEISVEKKGADQPDTYPMYKLIVTDKGGAKVNQGFYYFTPNPDNDDAYNEKRETQEVSRVLHIARAVMGTEYAFPAVSTSKEAYDVLFKLVADNAGGKKFNVFVTYGTNSRPSKYLGLRYFNFVETSVEGTTSRFRVGAQDMMTRLTEDAVLSQDKEAPMSKTSDQSWI
tara:strand:- start:55593 stop:56177 length:585 start_codon:yes stop_codon:yes gene_type:complete